MGAFPPLFSNASFHAVQTATYDALLQGQIVRAIVTAKPTGCATLSEVCA
jgi:hypothetical protein